MILPAGPGTPAVVPAPDPGADARRPTSASGLAARQPVATPGLAFASPGSGRLARLLEDARARRARLSQEIAAAEQAVAAIEAEQRAAQVVLDGAAADQGEMAGERALLLDRLSAAQQDMRAAEGQLTAVAAIGTTTPVAHPPPRGATPADQRARAERATDDALHRVDQMTTSLAEQDLALEQVGERLRAAETRVQALVQQARLAHDAVATLRQQMAQVGDELAASPDLLDALSVGAAPSALATSDIPPAMLDLYRRAAATCPGLPWSVLAAIGSVETSHGRADLPGVKTGANFAGAMGPMQFLAATWAAYASDGDGDGVHDVYNPADATLGAARYLCASGAGRPATLAAAIWAYNHADWYVEAVLEVAAGYGAVGLVADQAAVAALVARPNLILTPQAKADLLDGTVDPRLVALLSAASAEHRISVSVIRSGHAMNVAGTDRVSNHYYGRGVDIYAVDGAPVSASNDAAFELALSILASGPELRPQELGSPWTSLGSFAGTFSDEDHADHLHLGWRAIDTEP